jgi:uncharacterized protein
MSIQLIKQIIQFILPSIIVGLMTLVALIIKPINSIWIWTIFVGIYWIILVTLSLVLSGKKIFNVVLNNSKGKWYWNVIAVIISFGSITYLMQNLEYYQNANYLIAGIIFSIINPFIEETYWRKVVFDNIKIKWFFKLIYVNLIFALMHYFALGIISVPNNEIVIIPITFLAGIIWSIVYKKTGTLKYAILGHLMMDICGFSALFIR